jgi:hypothetical protein
MRPSPARHFRQIMSQIDGRIIALLRNIRNGISRARSDKLDSGYGEIR